MSIDGFIFVTIVSVVFVCRVEGAHNVLKKTLNSSRGELESVIESIDLMLVDQTREVRGQLEKERNTYVVVIDDYWLFDKVKHITSKKCICILHKSFKTINEGGMTATCNDGWWNICFGLPCLPQIH